MAKGEIKKLASAWQSKDEIHKFKRNTFSVGLQAIELERGEGKYLGWLTTKKQHWPISNTSLLKAKTPQLTTLHGHCSSRAK